MVEVLIFGGTTEGRELAEYTASMGISTLLSVVSEYGRRTAGESPGFSVRQGALDEEGIYRLLERERPCLILDATHPHAAAATMEIRRACERAGLPWLRVLRDPEKMGEGAAKEGITRDKGTGETPIFWVQTPQEAAELLKKDPKPVLLTTGSKELAVFAADPRLRQRIFARVLPDSQVLADCERQGISGKQLIAMQGPFSQEMNAAMLRFTGAGWLVTKESGSRGGFPEKLRAAKECKISTIVIQRPRQEPGISLEQARKELARLLEAGKIEGRSEREVLALRETEQREGAALTQVPEREVFLIGMGMGQGRQLTLEALEKLRQSEAVLGAPRMLEDMKTWIQGKVQEAVYLGRDVKDWLKVHPEYRRVAVVYSGDTGFYSGCGSLLKLLRGEPEKENKDPKEGEETIRIQIFPGISTLSCLCSRLGCSWEGIYPMSAHGRDCDVTEALKEHPKIFLLLGGQENLGSLCRKLTEAGKGELWVAAGIRLGYPEEQILTGTARDFQDQETDALTAVILRSR